MRSAHGAGFLYALATKLGITTPDVMVGSSIRDISTNVFQMKAPGAHVIAVAPQNLPAGKLTRDQKKLQKTFDQGVSDALSIENELRELFATS